MAFLLTSVWFHPQTGCLEVLEIHLLLTVLESCLVKCSPPLLGWVLDPPVGSFGVGQPSVWSSLAWASERRGRRSWICLHAVLQPMAQWGFCDEGESLPAAAASFKG